MSDVDTKDVVAKVAGVIVDHIAVTLLGNPAFVTSLATALSGQLDRPVQLQDDILAAIDKRMDEYKSGEKLHPAMKQQMADFVDERIEGIEIDSDNVTGLEGAIDSAVESALDNYEPEARNVSGLDDEISDWVSNNSENIEVRASNVSDLDEAIAETIANSKDLARDLAKQVLSELTLTVEAKVGGKSVAEPVEITVSPQH